MRSKFADQYIAEIAARKTPYIKIVDDIELRIIEGVYPTGKLGRLFNKALQLSEINLNSQKTVLDYGTGTGFLAIVAAKSGAKVVAIDKNPASIKCAKYNAKINNVVDNIDFRISDNLSAISNNETFDILVAGMPWEDAIPNNSLEMAFYDPQFAMRKDLTSRAKNILNNNGVILMSSSKRIQEANIIAKTFPNCVASILVEDLIHDEPHYILAVSLA